MTSILSTGIRAGQGPVIDVTVVGPGRGPVGPQGAPGTSGSIAQAYPAQGPISGHRAVAVTAAGAVQHADAATPAHALRMAGISLNAAVDGGDVVVTASGPVIEPTWSWTPDQPVYLGLAGALIQSAPTSAAYLLVVGWAVSPTCLFVNPQPPIFQN